MNEAGLEVAGKAQIAQFLMALKLVFSRDSIEACAERLGLDIAYLRMALHDFEIRNAEILARWLRDDYNLASTVGG